MIQIVSLDDRALWEEIQHAASIPSHDWSFNKVLSLSGLSPRLARVSHGTSVLVFPFFERQWRGRTDICTTLSVSGAWMTGADPGLFLAWADFARSRQWVAGYIQCEPETDVTGIDGAHPGNIVFLLDIDSEEPLGGASTIIRRKIRRMEASGLRLVEDRNVLAARISPLYAETMARAGASSAYNLAEAALREMVMSSTLLALGAERDGAIIAIMVFLVSGARAEYHIGASTAEGRDATAWLMREAILRLQAQGVKRLNLGGGVTPGDGLFDFKQKLGAVPKPLHHVKQIYDAAAYEAFCRDENSAADERWFPAYRAQVARQSYAPDESGMARD